MWSRRVAIRRAPIHETQRTVVTRVAVGAGLESMRRCGAMPYPLSAFAWQNVRKIYHAHKRRKIYLICTVSALSATYTVLR